MTTLTKPRSLLRIADLTPDELHRLLDLAAAMKEDPNGWHDALAGTSVACYFSKPSTRTRISFEAAVHRLGGLRSCCVPTSSSSAAASRSRTPRA